MKVLGETRSLCPVCLNEIKATIIEKNKKAIMNKTCKKHGTFEFPHLWDDPQMYIYMSKLFRNILVKPDEMGFELTSRCNMKCPFCFTSADSKGDEWKKIEISKKEIFKAIKNLKNQTISFTGGEPTVRKDLFEILKKIKSIGLKSAILTNGLKLDKEYVEKLKKAGVDKIQIQFDALDDETYEKIRGQKCLERKLKAISNLEDSNIHVNIFTMLAENINDDQINDIISFVAKNSNTLRAVMFSSLCYEGRYDKKLKKMSTSDIMKSIEKKTCIKKNDFMECTRFDLIFSQTIGTKLRTKSISPCDTICYLYVDSDKFTPVNRLINLSLISNILEKTTSNKIKLFLFLINPLNIKKIIKKKKALPFLINILIDILKQSLKKFIGRKSHISCIIGVLVTSFHNRYNLDLDFLKNCTIRVYDGKNFVPFCEKNIIWNRNKPISRKIINSLY